MRSNQFPSEIHPGWCSLLYFLNQSVFVENFFFFWFNMIFIIEEMLWCWHDRFDNNAHCSSLHRQRPLSGCRAPVWPAGCSRCLSAVSKSPKCLALTWWESLGFFLFNCGRSDADFTNAVSLQAPRGLWLWWWDWDFSTPGSSCQLVWWL